MKRTVIIVECISSSVNYIQDIRKSGYEPVALEVFVPNEKKTDSRAIHDLYYKLMDVRKPLIVEAFEKYEDTLAKVRELEPILVLPGGDEGIELATRLSHDLGLVGNNPDNIPKMRDKWLMQQALKEAGIRSIEGRIVGSVEEALEIFRKSTDGKLVLKPVVGAATVGVHICGSEEEVTKAMEENFSMLSGIPGSKGQIIAQEYIDGVEYVVNSVSSNGLHCISSVYEYNKRVIPGYGPIYENCINLSPTSPAVKPICDYATKVLDAVGFENGAVHAEYKLDKRGPVLIEVNCRVCGAMMKASWLDRFLPHHETDLCLRALLKPEEFATENCRSIEPVGYGMTVLTHLDKDTFVLENRQKELFGSLKSFVYESNAGGNRFYPRTIDLSTMGGIIYLSNSDKRQLEEDYDYIMKVNNTTPELIFIEK